jgi:hypothetical protein
VQVCMYVREHCVSHQRCLPVTRRSTSTERPVCNCVAEPPQRQPTGGGSGNGSQHRRYTMPQSPRHD